MNYAGAKQKCAADGAILAPAIHGNAFQQLITPFLYSELGLKLSIYRWVRVGGYSTNPSGIWTMSDGKS
jgi:hypothetical protein